METQGNFFLGFNAILNWNDLDAGRGQEFTKVHAELLSLLEAEGFSWTSERRHAA